MSVSGRMWIAGLQPQTDPGSKASPTSISGKLPGCAADTPALPNLREPGEPAAISPRLQPVETSRGNLQADDKLSARKEFDAESKKLTEPLFKALSDTLRTAREHFDRQHRLPAYATFKQDRDGKHAAGNDIAGKNSYRTIASQRMQNTAALRDEGDDGKSDLENLLPDDSTFRRLLEPATGSIRDVRTGLNADLTSREGPPPVYRLVFPGSGLVDTTGIQMGVNIRQFLGIGGVPAAYQDALKLAEEIKKQLPPGATLELGGHSLGGGIATYVGLKLGMKAVGFNSALLGPACMKDLRKSGCLTAQRLANVHQVRIEGDPISSKTVNKVMMAVASVGLLFASRVPRLLGTVHQISMTNDAHPKCGVLERHLPNAFDAAYAGGKPAKAARAV